MFVTSTCRRALTRRSTSGSSMRSWSTPQSVKMTAAATNRPIVRALAQPQSPPLEMASSRQIRPALSPIAPTTSNRP